MHFEIQVWAASTKINPVCEDSVEQGYDWDAPVTPVNVMQLDQVDIKSKVQYNSWILKPNQKS